MNSAAIIIYAVKIVQYYYMNIFYGKKVITAGSSHKPAVMSTHHQQFMKPAVMAPLSPST